MWERGQVTGEDAKKKKEDFEKGPKASEGYGGKFGVMTDRMDNVSVN
jgi:cortactin